MSEQPEETFGVGGGGWPLSGRQTIAALVVIAAGIFILQNTDEVSIDVFTVSVSAPLWIVLAAMFVIGALAGMLFQRRRGKADD